LFPVICSSTLRPVSITIASIRHLRATIGRLVGLFVMLFVWLGLSAPVLAAENTVIGMRLGSVEVAGAQALRVVIETKDPATAKLSVLHAPYRLVVDMNDTDWAIPNLAKSGGLSRAPAMAYRFGNPVPGTGRLVIELSQPAAPVRAFALAPNGGGHRLVIDLVDRGQTAFQVAAEALRKSGPTVFGGGDDASSASVSITKPVTPATVKVVRQNPATPVPSKLAAGERYVDITMPGKKPRRWIVFIDAGHGGKDPGAIGHSGSKEKDITLAAALELARQLRATGRVQPVLARDSDYYLKLRQRINLARKRNADLFISLHADSATVSTAHGISVFTLSDTASDKEAAALARKENKADLIGGPDLGVEDPEAANELLRMFQRESMNQSTHFASAILREIRDLPGGDRRGHRFAGFAVLKAPDMPSVLVEMGFMSNRKDEANLKKKSYRRELAKRLTRAVINYLSENGPDI
jgi:N-acetylmuramoyl-L-alanine amidase